MLACWWCVGRGMSGCEAKTHWTPFPPQMPPNPQPRPSLPPVPPHANADTFRHPANETEIPPIHLSPPSRNSSPPSLPHLYPLYPPLLLIAKSRWVLGPPRSHTTSIYPTRASTTTMCNLKVNNTTATPNGSTSRPDPDGNCRPMAGSEGHPEQTNWSESDNL